MKIAGNRLAAARPNAKATTWANPARRIDAEIARDDDRCGRRNTRGKQLPLLRNIGSEGLLQEVVTYRRGYDEQESRRRRQRRRKSTRRDEGYDPARQVRDLRIGEHHDIAVDIYLVGAFVVQRVRHPPFARQPRCIAIGRRTDERVALAVLHDAVLVLVGKGDEVVALPVLEPIGRGIIGGFVHRIDEVEPRERADRGCRRVEQGDEYQRPPRGLACVGGLWER